MKVILLQDVNGTGKKDEVCEVADSYARNVLIKKKLARAASSVELNSLKIRKEAEDFHRQEEIKRLTELAKSLNGKSVVCRVKAGENGKIFGSVTSAEIASAIAEIGFEVDKKKIVLREPIKKLGSYEAELKLISGVPCKITVVAEASQK